MAGAAATIIPTGAGMTSFRADGAGPPLILVHGLQVGKELFDGLRAHLRSSFTVITSDYCAARKRLQAIACVYRPTAVKKDLPR